MVVCGGEGVCDERVCVMRRCVNIDNHNQRTRVPVWMQWSVQSSVSQCW